LIDEVETKTLTKFSALKNSKIKKCILINKETNTQVKLHFEKTNFKNKIFSQRRLSHQFHGKKLLIK